MTQQQSTQAQAYRASILHFIADPAFDDKAYAWHEDGLLVVAEGRVQAAGDYAQLAPTLPEGTPIHDYRGKLIVPGFIDTPATAPQADRSISRRVGLASSWTWEFPTNSSTVATPVQ